MPVGMHVTMTGKFFEGPVAPRVQQAVKQGMEKVALQGQAWVQEQLYKGHGVVTGYFRRSITPDVLAWNHATVGSIVIYGTWLEDGPHGRQPQGRFRGYHIFRNAGERIEKVNMNDAIGRLVVEAFS